MVERFKDRFLISDDRDRIQFDTVHGWLTQSYWSPGITFDRVVRAAQMSSLVVGIYSDEIQVGYCRVVSDLTRFAWLCDVFIDDVYRGHGLGKAMVSYVLEHPDHLNIDRWMLGTLDAHGLYEQFGFQIHPLPQRLMVRQNAAWPSKPAC